MASLLASAVRPRSVFAAETIAPSTLVAAARALFPHAMVEDDKYAAIVARTLATAPDPTIFEQAAARLAGPATTISERIAENFATPGVPALRIATLIGLYADLEITRKFGYEGPSIDKGGYLERGFDDLRWLPEPGRAWLP
jgi:hypothetical protein